MGSGSLVVAAGVFTAALSCAPAAHASCAGPARPSPYAFIGTVVGAEEEDRIATVITDGGRQVTVLGTEDTSWWSVSISSTDRRYALGGRYEFHPLNSESPYRDDACTATEQLAGPRLQPVEQRQEFLPGWLPLDEQAGPVGYVILCVPLVAGILVLAAVGRRLLRRPLKTPG